MINLSEDWRTVLGEELEKPYFVKLMETVAVEYEKYTVYPPRDEIFAAFNMTPPDRVKVVIIGQDPYHGEGQAHGLAFSVREKVTAPPSLVNIFKELHGELGLFIPNNGCLTKWAEQGVLLLNSVLTVREHEAGSCRNIGWEKFTDAVIETLERRSEPMVYLLWGKPAQKKCEKIYNEKHLVLSSPHPSPLSAYRGFFGCGHFKKCNEYLEKNGLGDVDWQIENI